MSYDRQLLGQDVRLARVSRARPVGDRDLHVTVDVCHLAVLNDVGADGLDAVAAERVAILREAARVDRFVDVSGDVLREVGVDRRVDVARVALGGTGGGSAASLHQVRDEHRREDADDRDDDQQLDEMIPRAAG